MLLYVYGRAGRVPKRSRYATVCRDQLDPSVRARIYLATYRLASENTSAVKGVGEGVFEVRMNTGPGYRIYFGRDGDSVVLLLGSGTKQRQHDDIQAAKALWKEFKTKAREEQYDSHTQAE